MIAIEVTLSKWLYNALQAHEVLTVHRDYFRLQKPLERRLYKLARKHCGHQTSAPELRKNQSKPGLTGALIEHFESKTLIPE